MQKTFNWLWSNHTYISSEILTEKIILIVEFFGIGIKTTHEITKCLSKKKLNLDTMARFLLISVGIRLIFLFFFEWKQIQFNLWRKGFNQKNVI